jgi:hypothetical protein
MRRLALACLAPTALVLASGCTDATGSVRGGDQLLVVQQCTPTWTALYANYFGPAGQASCGPGNQANCHGSEDQPGAQLSGFVCGTSQDACWRGMTQGIPLDGGSSLAGLYPPLLPPDAGDLGQTQLLMGLHKTASSTGRNNMPCGNPTVCDPGQATYTFTSDDVTCISTWAQQGALNN